MFALLVITATLYVIEYRTVGGYFTAAVVFLVGSAFVEFWWPAVLFGLAVWWYCKRPGLMPLTLSLVDPYSHEQCRIPIFLTSLHRLFMRLLISLILPWLTFFTISRPFAGVICLILQITVIGWIPATIWAVYALGQYKTDKKIEKALNNRAIRG